MKEIPLDGWGVYNAVALVDDDVYLVVSRFAWAAVRNKRTGRSYAVCVFRNRLTWERKTIMMHRMITGAKPPFRVVHRDRDGLNNQRRNLVVCTHGQAMMRQRNRLHSSQYRGVTRFRFRWLARIKLAGRVRHLGSFHKEEDAARAYDEAARIAFGEFATPNLPAPPLSGVERVPQTAHVGGAASPKL